MSTQSPDPVGNTDLGQAAWQLDPARSRVEFRVPHFYGLVKIKGHFNSYDGTLDLRRTPAAELVIQASSLDTGNARRDKHLRSADFFDVENHPQVRLASDNATLQGDRLKLSGQLQAAGRSVPIEIEATLRSVDGELEIEATTIVDQRELGMTWSPMGITRTPSTLIVSGRLVPVRAAPSAT